MAKKLSQESLVNGKVMPHVPDLIDRMLELADGIKVSDEEGQNIYSRPPDRLAIEYLLNRAYGKPAVTLQSKTEVGVSSHVVIVLPDNGRDPSLF